MPALITSVTCTSLCAINGTDCIGDTRPIINANITNLGTGLCTLSSFANSILPITNAKIAFDGGAFSFRNKLINAQGLINQRVYVSGTATTTANQYTVDRWRVVTSGQNLTFSTSQNVVTFTAPAGGIEQVVEGLNIEAGTYVLNWTGTATATVNGTARTKGESFSLAGGSNVTVRFINGTFSLPQLERGVTPTPFEYRSFGLELSLCQRYFQSYPGNITNAGYTTNGTAQVYTMFLPVPMRISPAINFTPLNVASATLAYFDDGGSKDRIFFGVFSTLNPGVFQYTAQNATFNAEL